MRLRRKKSEGQSLVEYALLLALVVTVILLVVMTQLQGKVVNTYQTATNSLP